MKNFNITRSLPTYSDAEKGDSAVTRTGEDRIRFPLEASEEGLDLRQLAAGRVVEVQTRNSTYRIEVGEAGALLVSGHPEHCPEPVPAASIGSVLVTGTIYERFLIEGMRMEFRVRERRVFTSRIISIQVR